MPASIGILAQLKNNGFGSGGETIVKSTYKTRTTLLTILIELFLATNQDPAQCDVCLSWELETVVIATALVLF